VAIESLLQEIEGERFTGVASISSSSRNGTLVFKGGRCILVTAHNLRGDAAWDEIRNAGSEEVDAALSVLGDAQIELALEFNKPCRILKSPGQAAPAGGRPAATPAPSQQHPRSAMAQKSSAPVAPLKAPIKPAPVHHHVPAPPTAAAAHTPPPPLSRAASPVPPSPPQTPRPAEPPRRESGEVPEKESETTSSFEADLDTFDTMDFDNVTDKIRTDCKTMIKQLHLDHLMER
jgi:hypothetical protein